MIYAEAKALGHGEVEENRAGPFINPDFEGKHQPKMESLPSCRRKADFGYWAPARTSEMRTDRGIIFRHYGRVLQSNFIKIVVIRMDDSVSPQPELGDNLNGNVKVKESVVEEKKPALKAFPRRMPCAMSWLSR